MEFIYLSVYLSIFIVEVGTTPGAAPRSRGRRGVEIEVVEQSAKVVEHVAEVVLVVRIDVVSC